MKKTWLTLSLVALCGVTQAQDFPAGQLSGREIPVYQEHPEEVERMAVFNGRERAAELLTEYYVPQRLRTRLFQFVLAQERRKVTYNYLYPDSVFKRIEHKRQVESECADSIDRILIPYNDISGPNLRIALEFPQDVSLKQRQYEAIMSRALVMRKERLKKPTINLWEREFLLLDSVLSKKQMRDFFVLKYARTITKEMDASWQTLKDHNLDSEIDSTKSCAQIYMYNLSLYQVNDLYKYNTEKRKASIKAIESKAPKAVQLLNGIKRKEQAEAALRAKDKGKKKKEEKGNLFW